MSESIELLQRAADGDRRACDAAYAQVYPVLKRLARWQKRRVGSRDDANTTSIVNDACLRLMRSASPKDEAHFYGIAASAMRADALLPMIPADSDRHGYHLRPSTLRERIAAWQMPRSIIGCVARCGSSGTCLRFFARRCARS